MRFAVALGLTLLAGCGGEVANTVGSDASDALEITEVFDASPEAASDGGASLDARPEVSARDASPDPRSDAPTDGSLDAPADVPTDVPADVPTDVPMTPDGVAPGGAISGEVSARDGDNPFTLAPGGERVFRVEGRPTEHLGFSLTFAPPAVSLVMAVDRWNGRAPAPLGETDGGRGIRTLAAFDPSGPRTFWVRVRAPGAVTGLRLTVTRTPFRDDARCVDDCARLLQLPLANAPRSDGYQSAASTVFRYQFARRDLLMFVRHAAQTMARRSMAPFVPEDFSQWDGLTPGTDVGAPRHASHQRGKDVDISLYGADGQAPWRSYCTVQNTADGRECVRGTARDLDAAANVRMFADLFATHRVTMCFLDRELIARVQPAARAASLPASVLEQFLDGTHLQHWPNHDNHIHVRVSEGPTTGSALVFEPFEAP